MVSTLLLGLVVVILCVGGFCVFFDQAILTRRGTVYHVATDKKQVVLTFDDGPSPVWTPQILDALKKENIKAVFFMVGYHAQKYPDIARRVVREGHTIGNHGFAHSVMFYYTPAEIEEEIKYAEHVIKEITGETTKYFRPPKAWLRNKMKALIKSMGYETVLWSLNSKDWVTFNHKSMVRHIVKNVKNGDILLFHDSGNVAGAEGGNRRQTVKAVSLLARTLRDKGFEFVTIEELLDDQ
jgi:peptidoglycan/xylan/chitin deacetylase (PgdA/CDA1 family)